MTTRRDFLKLGALFVPAMAAPTVAYSFLWDNPLAKRTEYVLPQATFAGILFPVPTYSRAEVFINGEFYDVFECSFSEMPFPLVVNVQ